MKKWKTAFCAAVCMMMTLTAFGCGGQFPSYNPEVFDPSADAKNEWDEFESTGEDLSADRVKLGAIRWDAQVGLQGSDGLEVERVLSGKVSPTAAAKDDYHFRLPWYGVINEDDSVECRATSYEIIEREIRFAKASGLDYWATIWYGDHEDDTLSWARNMWTTSLQRNAMEWCHIFDTNFLSKVGNFDTAAERKLVKDIVEKDFRSDVYLKTKSGRPVYYIFEADTARYANMTKTLREECALAGLPEPYVVVMTWWTTEYINGVLEGLGASGVSNYVTAGGGGQAYSEIAAYERQLWSDWNGTNGTAVPLVTAGWDNRARYETKCKWYGDIEQIKDSWIQYPTDKELEEQVSAAVKFAEENPKASDFRSALVYAWNEYDEGGFIGPTLFDMKDGAAGSRPKRLDAVNRALSGERMIYDDISGSFAEDAIRKLSASYAFRGVNGSKFYPEKDVRVGEYVNWIVNLFGIYADVGQFDTPNAREIAIAEKTGILDGMDPDRVNNTRKLRNEDLILITGNVLKALNMSQDDSFVRELVGSISEPRVTRAKTAAVLLGALEKKYSPYGQY